MCIVLRASVSRHTALISVSTPPSSDNSKWNERSSARYGRWQIIKYNKFQNWIRFFSGNWYFMPANWHISINFGFSPCGLLFSFRRSICWIHRICAVFYFSLSLFVCEEKKSQGKYAIECVSKFVRVCFCVSVYLSTVFVRVESYVRFVCSAENSTNTSQQAAAKQQQKPAQQRWEFISTFLPVFILLHFFFNFVSLHRRNTRNERKIKIK